MMNKDIEDIARAISKCGSNLVVTPHGDGILIEPMNKEPIPIGTPVMVSDHLDVFCLAYYKGKGLVAGDRNKTQSAYFDYIIPYSQFDPMNIEESLKHNINKKQ